jgi:hypothetical protein
MSLLSQPLTPTLMPDRRPAELRDLKHLALAEDLVAGFKARSPRSEGFHGTIKLLHQ